MGIGGKPVAILIAPDRKIVEKGIKAFYTLENILDKYPIQSVSIKNKVQKKKNNPNSPSIYKVFPFSHTNFRYKKMLTVNGRTLGKLNQPKFKNYGKQILLHKQ